MMHDPRHWRLTLIYKAMFNVIFLFFFFFTKVQMDVWLLRQHTCLKKSVSVYLCYICLQYIYIFTSNWTQIRLPVDILLFFSAGDWIICLFFPPFHIEGILLKVWYSWFKEVARHEPKKQQHIFRDVLPTLLTLFFLFLPFVTSSLTEHHLSPSSLREIYACSLLRSSSLLGSFLTST